MSTVAGTPKLDLVRERTNAGYTIRALARHLGVNAATIKRGETGLPITPGNAKRIADFYGHQVSDIWPLEQAA